MIEANERAADIAYLQELDKQEALSQRLLKGASKVVVARELRQNLRHIENERARILKKYEKH